VIQGMMFGAALILLLSANGAAAIGGSLPVETAQQDDQRLNPTNDPDVQKGITREQIDYCARQQEQGPYWDSLSWSERQRRDAQIRYRCANPPAVGAVRG